MLIFEYKLDGSKKPYVAIEEAIRIGTVHPQQVLARVDGRARGARHLQE